MNEEELIELHDLAAGRLAHYRYVRARFARAEPRILASSTDAVRAKATVERIVARCIEWEAEAAGEVFAFREALGRHPRLRGRETSV